MVRIIVFFVIVGCILAGGLLLWSMFKRLRRFDAGLQAQMADDAKRAYEKSLARERAFDSIRVTFMDKGARAGLLLLTIKVEKGFFEKDELVELLLLLSKGTSLEPIHHVILNALSSMDKVDFEDRDRIYSAYAPRLASAKELNTIIDFLAEHSNPFPMPVLEQVLHE